MLKEKITEYVGKHRTSMASRLIIAIYSIFDGFLLFSATYTGYIPSHLIRYCLYSRIFRVKIPRDSIIYWRCRFFSPGGIHIGHNSIIGNDAFLDGRRELHIGNNVNISAEVRIYTLQHDIESPSFGVNGGSVYIKDWVSIGARVIILPDITIGEGAVVASGAVVTKNVEPWTVVGGIPARFIQKRPVVKYTLDTKRRALFQ
jgi:acetyltransferase-like isoleucine patch superfamily enzyme